MGFLKVTEWHPVYAAIDFCDPDSIGIAILYRYDLDVILLNRSVPLEQFEYSPSSMLGKIQLDHWTSAYDLVVPIALVKEWMNGRFEIKGNTEWTLAASASGILRYKNGKGYPAALQKFFRDRGQKAIEFLQAEGIIDDLTCEIIQNKIVELSKRSGQFDISDDSVLFVREKEVEEDQNLLEEQYVDMKSSDREKLNKIMSSRLPHSIRQWAELLGFQSPGAVVSFIVRMEAKGMLTEQKTPDGTRLVLTPEAVSILNSSS